MVAQFTVKTTNSEFAIYFLSLKSCSINKQKSHILFTCKTFTKTFFFRFDVEKKFVPGNGGGLALLPPPPVPIVPAFAIALLEHIYIS